MISDGSFLAGNDILRSIELRLGCKSIMVASRIERVEIPDGNRTVKAREQR